MNLNGAREDNKQRKKIKTKSYIPWKSHSNAIDRIAEFNSFSNWAANNVHFILLSPKTHSGLRA